MANFKNGERVKITKHGVTVEGRIVSGRDVFYPDSTLNKYGNGSMGRAAWGYKVSAPIVFADGSIYTNAAGNPLNGCGYVEASMIEKII